MTATIATMGLAVAPAFAVAVDAVNDGTALATFQTIAEDASATNLDVIANDLGVNGTTSVGLTITAKTDGTHGTVAIVPGLRSVTYTPNANDSGDDSFTYTVTDGVTIDTATVFVTVNAVNDAPSFTLLADPTVAEDSGAHTVVAFATANAGGPEEGAQTFTYVIESNSNAALFSAVPAISPVGALSYTGAANANGSATIVTHVVDNGPNGGGDVNFSPPQTFHINITAVNDAPVAVADGPYQAVQGMAFSRPALTGVLANDTDIDTAHGTLTAVLDVNVAHGLLTLNADGSFTYTPTASYTGADSFTYHASDGALSSNIVSVTFNVIADNAPDAVADSATIVAGSSFVPVNVLGNDTDADGGDVLHITAVTNPPHGSASITGGGTGLSYRPDAGFIGTDTFTYTISDGVLTDSALVTVTVPKDTFKPVATAPLQTIRAQTLGSTSVVVYLSWGGTDVGSGVSSFQVWQSVNGHAYTKVKTTSAHTMTFTAAVGTTYQFRVRAVDKAGNVGNYAYGPAFKAHLYQETSASYSVPWTLLNSSSYSGGHARGTTHATLSASFHSIGRTFAFVTDRAANRGTADVFVDGVLQAHLTLTAATTSYKYVAYSITFATSGSHTLQVVYTGPTNKRVDVDAFVVLR